MATTTRPREHQVTVRPEARRFSDPAYQGFWILRLGFTVAPILFGLDKFADWLVDWQVYLAPEINDLVPGDAHEAMLAVGVIEVAAGLGVALRPRLFSYVVAAWLGVIIVNLLLIPYLLDAVRALELGVAGREDIDTAMKLGCGMPMGPLELQDFAGVDIGYYVGNIFFEYLKDARFSPPTLLRNMIKAGYHGRKTGRGFYDYSEKK